MNEQENRIAEEMIGAYLDGRGVSALSDYQADAVQVYALAWAAKQSRLSLLPAEVLRDLVIEAVDRLRV